MSSISYQVKSNPYKYSTQTFIKPDGLSNQDFFSEEQSKKLEKFESLKHVQGYKLSKDLFGKKIVRVLFKEKKIAKQFIYELSKPMISGEVYQGQSCYYVKVSDKEYNDLIMHDERAYEKLEKKEELEEEYLDTEKEELRKAKVKLEKEKAEFEKEKAEWEKKRIEFENAQSKIEKLSNSKPIAYNSRTIGSLPTQKNKTELSDRLIQNVNNNQLTTKFFADRLPSDLFAEQNINVEQIYYNFSSGEECQSESGLLTRKISIERTKLSKLTELVMAATWNYPETYKMEFTDKTACMSAIQNLLSGVGLGDDKQKKDMEKLYYTCKKVVIYISQVSADSDFVFLDSSLPLEGTARIMAPLRNLANKAVTLFWLFSKIFPGV